MPQSVRYRAFEEPKIILGSSNIHVLQVRIDTVYVRESKKVDTQAHNKVALSMLQNEIIRLKNENDSLRCELESGAGPALARELDTTRRKLQKANAIAAPIRSAIKHGDYIYIAHRNFGATLIMAVIIGIGLGSFIWIYFKKRFLNLLLRK